MTHEQITALAAEAGFSAAAIVGTDQIVFDPSFRPYCAENLCGQYGANYSCPPDCGTPDEMKEKVLKYKHALVLQTIWEISDYTDAAAIKNGKQGHNQASVLLMQQLREAGHPGFMIGAGGCGLCTPCALKKGEPCRFPDLRYSCMSAYCIFVKKLADSCGMEYDCGEGLLAFFGAYIFD